MQRSRAPKADFENDCMVAAEHSLVDTVHQGQRSQNIDSELWAQAIHASFVVELSGILETVFVGLAADIDEFSAKPAISQFAATFSRTFPNYSFQRDSLRENFANIFSNIF